METEELKGLIEDAKNTNCVLVMGIQNCLSLQYELDFITETTENESGEKYKVGIYKGVDIYVDPCLIFDDESITIEKI